MKRNNLTVCMVTTTFPRWAGDGQGAFVWGLARALSNQGIRVKVIALHTPNSLTKEWIEGVEVIRPIYWWPVQYEKLLAEGGGLPITLRKYYLARFQLLIYLILYVVVAAKHALSAEIIHAHWTLSGLVALLGKFVHKRPVIITVQGSDILQVTKSKIGRILTHAILKRCQRTVALSSALQRATAAIGIPISQIAIIPNGVNPRQFMTDGRYTSQFASREAIILFVGSLIERKGARYLLDAIPAILKKHPEYSLVLIGEGPEQQALLDQSALLGISEHIQFLGFQPQEEVSKWMRRARVFVLPSLEEGQGVVLLEAIASGTPVVATNVDGIPDVITSDVGRLISTKDPTALAQAVTFYLDEPVLWEKASCNAIERAKTVYDWEKIAFEYVNVYHSVLEATGTKT